MCLRPIQGHRETNTSRPRLWFYCDLCDWGGTPIDVLGGLWRTDLDATVVTMQQHGLLEHASPHLVSKYRREKEEQNKAKQFWQAIQRYFANSTRDTWWSYGSLWAYRDPCDLEAQASFAKHAAVIDRAAVTAAYPQAMKRQNWLPHWLVVVGRSMPGRISGFAVYGHVDGLYAEDACFHIPVNDGVRESLIGEWWANASTSKTLWIADPVEALRLCLLSEGAPKVNLCGPLSAKWRQRSILPIIDRASLHVWDYVSSGRLVNMTDKLNVPATFGRPRYKSMSVQRWAIRTVDQAIKEQQMNRQQIVKTGSVMIGKKMVTWQKAKTLSDGKEIANVRMVFSQKFKYRNKTLYSGYLEREHGLQPFCLSSKTLSRHFSQWTRLLATTQKTNHLPLRINSKTTNLLVRASMMLKPPTDCGRIYPRGWIAGKKSYAFRGFEIREFGEIVKRPLVDPYKADPIPSRSLKNTIISYLSSHRAPARREISAAFIMIASGAMRASHSLPPVMWFAEQVSRCTGWYLLGCYGDKLTIPAEVNTKYESIRDFHPLPRWIRLFKGVYADYVYNKAFSFVEQPHTQIINVPKCGNEQAYGTFSLTVPEIAEPGLRPIGLLAQYLYWLGIACRGRLPKGDVFEERVAQSIQDWCSDQLGISDFGIAGLDHLVIHDHATVS